MQENIFTADVYKRIIELYETNPAFKKALLDILNNTSKGEKSNGQHDEPCRDPER